MKSMCFSRLLPAGRQVKRLSLCFSRLLSSFVVIFALPPCLFVYFLFIRYLVYFCLFVYLFRLSFLLFIYLFLFVFVVFCSLFVPLTFLRNALEMLELLAEKTTR